MTYEYKCINCRHRFEVVKSYKEMDVNEYCTKCGEPGERQFVPSILHLSKTKVTHAEYNPGLGCVVKNADHKKEILKKRGLIEIGNDFKTGNSMTDYYDNGRKEKLKKRWEED